MFIKSLIKWIQSNLKALATCGILLSTFYSYSQDSIRISGQLLNNTKFAKVVVRQFGIGIQDIAAIEINKETGKFFITAPMDIAAGVYRFQYSQTSGDYVDVILNGKEKEVYFTLDVSKEATQRMPEFTKSIENIAWQNFEQQRKVLYQEIEVLDGFIGVYPNKKDTFYLSSIKERGKKVQNYQQFKTTFIKTIPHYFAKQMAAYTANYFANPTENWRLQEFYKFENFWQGKPTLDEALLNTPLYSEAILDYLKYYMNPDIGFSENEMNTGFQKCVDTIIKQFEGNERTKEFAIKYLQLGFKEIGNEELLKYIDVKYAVQEQCTDGDSELKKRLAGYEAMQPGMLAPNIELKLENMKWRDESVNGKTENLYDVKAIQTIVVFWASWCPHCMEEMPKLNEWAKSNPTTQVIAISLDYDKTAYETAIKNFTNLSLYCDFKKWDGKIVSDYYVYGTPTFFELDKDKKIIKKIVSWDSIDK